MNKNAKQLLAAICLCIAMTGCAAVDVTKTASGHYDRTDANTVEILKTRPERSFVELGTVTVTGFDPDQSAKMHNAIRAKSAALGANAVILTEEGILASMGGPQKWATGVAIRWK